MARAMEYLVIQSLTEFQRLVKDLDAEGPKTLATSPEFRSVLNETNELRGRPGYVGHPKMSTLREMCAAHFERCASEVDPDTSKPVETRVMVFCNYRAVVDEIVDCLNQQRPLIKATAFVGQSSAKGVKGKTQKDQIEVRRLFRLSCVSLIMFCKFADDQEVQGRDVQRPRRNLDRRGGTRHRRDRPHRLLRG